MSGSGTNRTTHTHTVYERKIVMRESSRIDKDEPVEHSVEFQIPADGPYSFSASDNNIEWEASVHVDIDNWPDWSREQEIRVLV